MNIVISGGSSGFGLAMARELTNRKHNVLISGRDINKLCQIKKSVNLQIYQCDVQYYKQVKKLGSYANYIFDNKIDHWINSAAICEGPIDFEDLELSDIKDIVSTNLLGTLYGCKVAENNKAKNIYIISGHGSNGASTDGFPIYGLCKAGLKQFTKTNSCIHTIAPGIMRTLLTKKLLDQNKIVNFFAKEPEEVAKIIVPKIVNISGKNQVLRA
jgi:short-subunit dehydrogenase